MTRAGLVLTLLLLAPLAFAPAPATAHGTWTHCGLPETPIDVDGDGHPELYLVEDATGWMYMYQESNGIQHLQRGFAGDTCDEGVDADHAWLIF